MNDFLSYVSEPGLIGGLLAIIALVGAVFIAKSRNSDVEDGSSTDLAASQPKDDQLAKTGGETEVLEAQTPLAAQKENVVQTEPEQVAAEPELDIPDRALGRMGRLRSRLARSGALGTAILSVFSRGALSEADWEEIEDTLLMADLGTGAVEELMSKLRLEAKVLGSTDANAVVEILRRELLALVGPQMDRSLNLDRPLGDSGEQLPATILVVGVNGTGKTTTVGKIARLLVAQDRKVLLGAADTFRAAAAEQLQTWGGRVGVDVIRSEKEGADPAAVAFDTVAEGISRGSEVVLVDTAGRLQNKTDLMDELGKVKRVMQRKTPIAETLLVLDASTGQNGLQQAKVFAQVVDISGIVLTKLDGSAKGGIVVSVQRELGVPVKLVGLGEGPDDLAPFEADTFVNALLNIEK